MSLEEIATFRAGKKSGPSPAGGQLPDRVPSSMIGPSELKTIKGNQLPAVPRAAPSGIK